MKILSLRSICEMSIATPSLICSNFSGLTRSFTLGYLKCSMSFGLIPLLNNTYSTALKASSLGAIS